MKKVLASAAVGALLLSSCMSVNLKSSLVVPASLSNAAGREYTLVAHFRRDFRIFFTVNGLIAISSATAALDKLLAEEVARYHGDGVVNVAIKDEYAAVDGLISAGLATVGIVAGGLFVVNQTNQSHYGYYGISPSPVDLAIGAGIAVVPSMALQSRTVSIEGDIFQFR